MVGAQDTGDENALGVDLDVVDSIEHHLGREQQRTSPPGAGFDQGNGQRGTQSASSVPAGGLLVLSSAAAVPVLTDADLVLRHAEPTQLGQLPQ